jgi:hypothetical protein
MTIIRKIKWFGRNTGEYRIGDNTTKDYSPVTKGETSL